MTEKSEKTLGLIIIVATVLVATMTAIFAQMNKGSYENTERQSEIQTLLPDKKGGQLEFYGTKPKRGGDSSGDIMRQALREFSKENRVTCKNPWICFQLTCALTLFSLSLQSEKKTYRV